MLRPGCRVSWPVQSAASTDPLVQARAFRLLASLQASDYRVVDIASGLSEPSSDAASELASEAASETSPQQLNGLHALIMLSVDECLLPLLGRATAEGRLTDVPEPVHGHLLQAAALNEQRNIRIRIETQALIQLCNRLDIVPVLLKSTAQLMQPRVAYLQDRLIGDIDLLISPAQIPVLAAKLLSLGFASDPRGEADSDVLKHYPRLIAPDRIAPIEIHRCLAEVCWAQVLSPDLLRSAQEVRHMPLLAELAMPGQPGADLVYAVPALAHRVVHTFIHDQLDNGGWWHARVDLRGVYDVVHDLMHAQSAPDWAAIEQLLAGAGLWLRFQIWASWLADLYPGLETCLPFPLRPERQRYLRHAECRPGLWSWLAAAIAGELEQLYRSPAYRRRALRRILTLGAYRHRLDLLKSRLQAVPRG